MTFVVILPLLYAIIFRRSFVFLLRIVRCKGTAKEWNERLDTLSLSLLFPGMIYYLNVLSIEQFTLLLSLFVFILRSGIGITLLLIAFIFSIDKGNALIVLSLISLNWFVLRYIDGIKLSKYFVSVISVAIGVYFINFLIIEYLSAIAFLQQKITAILHKYSGVDVVKKYPVILRPAITYMSFIALTPAYLKSVLAYIVTAVSILLTILKIMKLYLWHKKNKLDLNSLKRRVVMAFNAIIVILGFIFILPDYANGKYYIFMMPFILLLFFTIYSKKHIYLFMLVLNSIVFANYYSFIT